MHCIQPSLARISNFKENLEKILFTSSEIIPCSAYRKRRKETLKLVFNIYFQAEKSLEVNEL